MPSRGCVVVSVRGVLHRSQSQGAAADVTWEPWPLSGEGHEVTSGHKGDPKVSSLCFRQQARLRRNPKSRCAETQNLGFQSPDGSEGLDGDKVGEPSTSLRTPERTGRDFSCPRSNLSSPLSFSASDREGSGWLRWPVRSRDFHLQVTDENAVRVGGDRKS